MRPPQEVHDIRQVRPFGMKRILPYNMILETTIMKTLKTRIIGGSEESPDLYDLGMLPLWNLADYGSCQYPRSRCIGERPEHGALELKVFCQETLRQEISTME